MQTDQNKFVTSSPTDYEMRFIKAWPLSFPVCDLSCQAQAEIMSPKEDSTSLVLDVVMMTWWPTFGYQKVYFWAFLHSSYL